MLEKTQAGGRDSGAEKAREAAARSGSSPEGPGGRRVFPGAEAQHPLQMALQAQAGREPQPAPTRRLRRELRRELRGGMFKDTNE